METKFFDRLKKIFTSTSVIRDPKTNKLKVIDVNKLQAYRSYESNRAIDNFIGARSSTNGMAYSSMGYDPSYGFHMMRNELYRGYEDMDGDPIISSALDIYADESTLMSDSGDVLKVNSTKKDIQESLENLFNNVLNINFNLWPWVRNMVKYGDFFLKLDIVETIGVTNVIPLSPYYITRLEDPNSPESIIFQYEAHDGVFIPKRSGKTYFEQYEIAHFRNLSDTNFLPYGKSMLEGVRKIWYQLSLMEDAMMIHRIMRAPQKRVFKIDVGNIPPNEIDNYMNQIIDKMKKVPYMDEQTGQINLKFNLQNMLEDYFLPVRGNNSATAIEDLSGMEWTGTEDIDYLRNRMMAGLKIPKAYFGYAEDLASKATLAGLDIRFARTIERLQRIIVSELGKIAIVHLASQGFEGMDLVDFSLNLTTSSTLYEMEKVELLTQKVALVRDAKELRMLSFDKLYREIFKLTDEEIEDERNKCIEDAKLAYRLEQIATTGTDPAKSPTPTAFGEFEETEQLNKKEKEYTPVSHDSRLDNDSPALQYYKQNDITKTDPHDRTNRFISHSFRGNSLNQEHINHVLKGAGLLGKINKNKISDKKTILTENSNNSEDVEFKNTFLDEKILI